MSRKSPRQKGTGSVYKSGSVYRVQKEIGIIDGKRKYKRWTFHTLKEAQAFLRTLQGRTISAHKVPTLGEYLSATLADAESRLRPRTLKSYQLTIEHHITPYLGHILVPDLTPDHVETWLRQHALKHPKLTATRRYARAALRALLRPAQRKGWLTSNPAGLSAPPAHRKKPIQPLTPHQAQTLLKAAEGHWLHPIVLTLLGLGLRIGEALGLQWKDVDFDAGTVTIRRAIMRAYVPRPGRKTSMVIADTKSDASRRTITLPATITATLEQHRKAYAPLRSKWVFCGTKGQPRDPYTVQRAFGKLRTKAGLPTLRLHDLRHSTATFALLLGIAPRTVADMLGHSSTQTTLETYTHVLPALREGVASQIDQMLRGLTQAYTQGVQKESISPEDSPNDSKQG